MAPSTIQTKSHEASDLCGGRFFFLCNCPLSTGWMEDLQRYSRDVRRCNDEYKRGTGNSNAYALTKLFKVLSEESWVDLRSMKYPDNPFSSFIGRQKRDMAPCGNFAFLKVLILVSACGLPVRSCPPGPPGQPGVTGYNI